MTNKNRAATGFVFNGLGWILGAVIALAVSAVMVRIAGLDQYGDYVFITSVFAILAPILGLGLGDALVRFGSEYLAHDGKAEVKWLASASIGLLVIFDLAVSLLIVVIWSRIAPAQATLVALVALSTVLNAWQTVLAYTLQGYYEQGFVNAVGTIASLVLLAGVTFVALKRPSLEAMVLVTVLALALRIVLYWSRLRRLQADAVAGRPAATEGQRIIQYATYAMLIQLTAYVVWQASETFFLGLYRSSSEVALYKIAYMLPQRLVDFVSAILGSLGLVILTQIHANDPTALRGAAGRLVTFEVLGVTPICIWIVIGAEWLLRVLFGPEALPAVAPMRVLAVAYSLSIFNPVVAIIFRVKEQMRTSLIFNLGLTGISIGLDLLLIPTYGVWGAVAATSTVMIMGMIIHTVWATRAIGSYIPFHRLGKAVPAAGVLIGFYAMTLLHAHSFLAFLAFSALGLVLYAWMLHLSRVFTPADYDVLASIPRDLTAKFKRPSAGGAAETL